MHVIRADHRVGCIGGGTCSHAFKHVDLGAMLIWVTGGTIGGSMFDPQRVGGMLDLQVALETVHLVVCHVLLMNELVIIDTIQVVLPVVTDDAPFVRHCPVSPCQITVATAAVHAACKGEIVVERGTAAKIKFIRGNLVAARAGTETLIELLVFKMAQKARVRGHGHVAALHDLAVTARATELLSAA